MPCLRCPIPVKTDTLLGAQIGATTYVLVNRTPDSTILSRCGVLILGCPIAPSVPSR